MSAAFHENFSHLYCHRRHRHTTAAVLIRHCYETRAQDGPRVLCIGFSYVHTRRAKEITLEGYIFIPRRIHVHDEGIRFRIISEVSAINSGMRNGGEVVSHRSRSASKYRYPIRVSFFRHAREQKSAAAPMAERDAIRLGCVRASAG